MKPLIGLTPTPELMKQEHGVFRLNTLSDNYSMAIENAGGIPVMLPAHVNDVAALLARIDGLVITGGGDIDPRHFDQSPHPKTADVDAERDAFELAAFREAQRIDLPVLGICRGLQIFNVALGGTLFQDVADLKQDAIHHRQHVLGIEHTELFHDIHIKDGDNALGSATGSRVIRANSFHHQGIDDLADGLVAIATTDDGLIEAVEFPDMSFALAVQWHPEMLAPEHPEHAAIFAALIDAARSRLETEEPPR